MVKNTNHITISHNETEYRIIAQVKEDLPALILGLKAEPWIIWRSNQGIK